MKILSVDIKKIYPNKNQPRKTFDKQSIEELSESIRRYGLIQPLVISEEGDGYLLVAGERRFRALQKLGMESVPCILREAEEIEEIALIENLQREDLNALDKAKAIDDFMRQNNLTQAETAVRLSKTRSYIANCVRLLHLDEYSKDLLHRGKLSEGHAKALLAIKEETKRQEIVRKILAEGLSVRATEKISREIKKSGSVASGNSQTEDILFRDAEEQLTELFGTKVRLMPSPDRSSGQILIEYYSEEQLLDIVDRLLEIK